MRMLFGAAGKPAAQDGASRADHRNFNLPLLREAGYPGIWKLGVILFLPHTGDLPREQMDALSAYVRELGETLRKEIERKAVELLGPRVLTRAQAWAIEDAATNAAKAAAPQLARGSD